MANLPEEERLIPNLGDRGEEHDLAGRRETWDITGEERPERRRSPWLALWVLLGGLAVAGVVWVINYALSEHAPSGGETPLIAADSGPVRAKPDKPGGVDIPNRDKLVYKSLEGEASQANGPEQLLPAPEEPLPKPTQPAGSESVAESLLQAADDTEPAATEAAAPAVKEQGAANEVSAAGTKAEAPAEKKSPAKNATAEKQPASAPAKAAVAPPKPVGAGQAMIQLGATRSEEGARAESERLLKKYGDLLGKLQLSIVRADLGAKGVWFRLRSGPFGDRAAAEALCEQLKARGAACTVPRS